MAAASGNIKAAELIMALSMLEVNGMMMATLWRWPFIKGRKSEMRQLAARGGISRDRRNKWQQARRSA